MWQLGGSGVAAVRGVLEACQGRAKGVAAVWQLGDSGVPGACDRRLTGDRELAGNWQRTGTELAWDWHGTG